MMKHKLFELWKEYEGSRPVWKIQLEKSIITFMTKTKAVEFQKVVVRETYNED